MSNHTTDVPFLKELSENQYDPEYLLKQYDALMEQYKMALEQVEYIRESVILKQEQRGKLKMAAGEDMTDVLDRISKQFDAAKKGLGLANKLPKGESRKKHASRIMGNLNTIRAALRRVEKQIANAL